MTRDRGRIQREDISGKRYGRLTVLRFDDSRRNGRRTYWICRCSCKGVIKSVRADSLIDGSIRSCGCLGKERRLKGCTRHGKNRRKSRSPVYSLFFRIRNICRNPKARDYRRYGGKGVKLRFDNFQQLLACVGEKPSFNHRLERIDKDGNWEPGNLHWVELKPQRRRRRVSMRNVAQNVKTSSTMANAA